MKNVISVYPNKDLATVTRDIPKDQIIGDTYRQIGASMLEILRKKGGIGLSANQVGLPLNMCVIELTKNQTQIMLNPRIIKQSDRMVKSYEGCLSLPGVKLNINRHKSVTVEYEDVTGDTKQLEGHDLLAFCLQHEIDHLKGITMLNRVTEYYRQKALKDLQRYKKYHRKYK